MARRREITRNYMRRESANYRKRHLDYKLKVIEMMGGKCVKCGWAGHHAGFEFDHIVPLSGRPRIASLLKTKDMTRALEELKFCQLLCAICHRIKTWEEGSQSHLRRRKVVA